MVSVDVERGDVARPDRDRQQVIQNHLINPITSRHTVASLNGDRSPLNADLDVS